MSKTEISFNIRVSSQVLFIHLFIYSINLFLIYLTKVIRMVFENSSILRNRVISCKNYVNLQIFHCSIAHQLKSILLKKLYSIFTLTCHVVQCWCNCIVSRDWSTWVSSMLLRISFFLNGIHMIAVGIWLEIRCNTLLKFFFNSIKEILAHKFIFFHYMLNNKILTKM